MANQSLVIFFGLIPYFLVQIWPSLWLILKIKCCFKLKTYEEHDNPKKVSKDIKMGK